MTDYLDYTGLSEYDSLIKSYITSQGLRNQVYYTTCSTDASTANKVITITGWTPTADDILCVKFTTASTVATPTLSINNTVYNIMIAGSSINATSNTLKWSANTIILFIFNGTQFEYIYARASAQNKNPDGAGNWWGISSTADGTATKVSDITNFRLTVGAIVSIKFTYAQTSLQALKLNVNSTGAKNIRCKDRACSTSYCIQWAAGDILTFMYDGSYWQILNKEVVIYRNSTGVGVNSSLTLSRTALDFNWIDIIFTDGNRRYSSKLYQADGKTHSLMRVVNNATAQYLDSLMISISGTTITTGNGMQTVLDNSTFSDTNCHISIIEVRGGF